jgi:hypothetical protein
VKLRRSARSRCAVVLESVRVYGGVLYARANARRLRSIHGEVTRVHVSFGGEWSGRSFPLKHRPMIQLPFTAALCSLLGTKFSRRSKQTSRTPYDNQRIPHSYLHTPGATTAHTNMNIQMAGDAPSETQREQDWIAEHLDMEMVTGRVQGTGLMQEDLRNRQVLRS